MQREIAQSCVKQVFTNHSQRNQPEEGERLFRSRRSGFGQNSGWQDTKGDHSHTPIHLPSQQRPQNRGLDRYGLSTSAPLTPQGSVSMEHGKQEVQPGFKLGRTWAKLPEDMSQRDIVKSLYGNKQRLEFQQAIQTLRREGFQYQG
ncbi:hypothetical protein O181_023825 [Austropuccinia psidii MF-1]|uniref:Uncharacterized protein n=1 Tax=Austropuccinia psidii MF-1 TaxID=1389203 RepID=A0A9Q3CJU0_9BASI|nr:hypothetical protein [Austropuccinia psidii MF-1]